MDPETTKAESLREKFSAWFNSELGRQVFYCEQQQLADILPGLLGYRILQYGHAANSNYLSSSRIVNQTVLFLDDVEIDKHLNAIHTQAEALPIAADSIDVIVLPHILEYSKDPRKLLRELGRVLIGQGHVIIIGINPLSLWGLWHLFLCWWGKMPWSGQLISIHRLKDWLSLLDFEVEKTNCFFFSPPIQRTRVFKKFMPLERFGRYCWPVFGGLYMVNARKRVFPLNPVRMQWRTKQHIIGAGIAETTTRDAVGSNG